MNRNFVIVASGPSAKGFVPPDDVMVICVNQSINFMPRCDHWFTLDPSPANIKTMNDRREGVKYWCAIDGVRRSIPEYVTVLKRVGQSHIRPKTKDAAQWNIYRLQCRLGLDKRKGYISTGNSAWGALGLAYHLGANKVALIGVDASTDAKIDGGYCRTHMEHLPVLFSSAKDQIEMVSCGKMVADGIPNMTIDEGMKWLMS